MSASEKLKALQERIEELTGQIVDGLPAVSSGDGPDALSELDDLIANVLIANVLTQVVPLVRAAEEWRAEVKTRITDERILGQVYENTMTALAELEEALS